MPENQFYTANYTYTNPNFVIQNLETSIIQSEYLPSFFVLKNILQRGFPTMISKYLQGELEVALHKTANFRKRLLLIDITPPIWHNTIKGDDKENYFPAKEFFEQIPSLFGEYAFIQQLIQPEVLITDIIHTDRFKEQQVDFYLPQAKLVIEIDGAHHKEPVQKKLDSERDDFLWTNNILTIRITTQEWRENKQPKIDLIINRLQQAGFTHYKNAAIHTTNGFTDEEIKRKLLPTAIIRFQILLLELLSNGHISMDKPQKIYIKRHETILDFADLAIKDIEIWLKNLLTLRDIDVPTLNWTAEYVDNFENITTGIKVDFSLLKRFTDENLLHQKVYFLRGAYFDSKNHFEVSVTNPITYPIVSDKDSHKAALQFFLQNIFDKPDFRDGQMPIIANALRRQDTIGLLPTGSGKSVCYQLSCLLQPCINFVVCPIKSLMYDQNENLKEALISHTNFITGDLDAADKKKVQTEFAERKYLFIFISPERFQIQDFRNFLRPISHNIGYAVIDEVHCLSEWGHDFRTSYLNLAKTIRNFCPNTKFLGLTATASLNVLTDIRAEFNIDRENVVTPLNFSRKELIFEVKNLNTKQFKRVELKKLIEEEDFIYSTEKAAVVFTPNVNGPFGCYEVHNELNTHFPNAATWYSGSQPTGFPGNKDVFAAHKKQAQKDFKENKFPIMVATKAFGMGIDKSNIHYTFHYGVPGSVASLYQEAGRAGRWENKEIKAKCYVLFHDNLPAAQKALDDIFDPNISITDLKTTIKSISQDAGKDILRSLFMFSQNQREITEWVAVMNHIILQYANNDTSTLFFTPIRAEISNLSIIRSDGTIGAINGTNEEITDFVEIAIYKLSLLGIVNDWTTDFSNHYNVVFNQWDEASVLKSLSTYIKKYDPLLDIAGEINKRTQTDFLSKAISFLIEWSNQNIVASRKQGIKTIVEWTKEFKDSESFKKRIDSYFQITERTFVFQNIAENPKQFDLWFKIFYEIERNGLRVFSTETEIGTGFFLNSPEREQLRDSLSRYLESYHNNVGLNVISGLVRLSLNNYSDKDGKDRLDEAFFIIQEKFEPAEQEEIIHYMIAVGQNFDEANRTILAKTIIEWYPKKKIEIAEKLNSIELIAQIISENKQKLNQLNKKLYEFIN